MHSIILCNIKITIKKGMIPMARYAVSDLHGHLEIYKQIKAMLKPGDIVYCLGDCGDRGPRPWETIKAVYEDPQFIYLKGNHEDMLSLIFAFCYEQTSPLDVHLYTFGFSLSILNIFSYLPKKEM